MIYLKLIYPTTVPRAQQDSQLAPQKNDYLSLLNNK